MKKTNDFINQEYLDYVKEISPKTKEVKTLFRAFWVGGFICSIGQTFRYLLSTIFNLSGDQLAGAVSMLMIFIGSLLTGLGIYDRIGKYAGGGSIVPITGFANSVTSSAMEYKSEGIVTGIINNMLKLAGSIIVTGIISAFIVSTILFLLGA